MRARTSIWLSAVIGAWLVLAVVWAVNVYGQRARGDKEEKAAETQWEYLIVSGGRNNLSSAGNEQYPTMRKQTDFPGEAFTIERNLDKLGTKGWELVAVYGPPTEPVYYLKRKRSGE